MINNTLNLYDVVFRHIAYRPQTTKLGMKTSCMKASIEEHDHNAKAHLVPELDAHFL